MREIFGRYLRAGAMSHDADALAELFTEDGVYEAPLVPPGHAFPNRLEGREAIRAAMAAYYARATGPDGAVDAEKTRLVLHDTADPDVFMAEIDTVFDTGVTVSLVQIFRLRDGRIALLRDYFAPDVVG
ncbi:nuclear transport factor 2 family protein [Kutzneria buriramensis]|uniref:Uncharacterized protein (TIGR02246 family) n=1 Tax=Kutzneria buriramensis TaxID=1045776 RepID=A0A3E0HF12_9PSEU|nr:nuclear transport factor 2 family protein [Kutzneria buriramensis]REH43790.1 uncharacterized protein (TIGR02246 family) [Kutzneria buriramensis]